MIQETLEQIIRRLSVLEKEREASASVENDAHFRLDNVFGYNSIYTQWFNRVALPATANANDREMTADPTTGNWAWTTAPATINASSAYNVAFYPHNLHTYIYGAGAGQADLRCTSAGNLPRFKRLIISTPAIADTGAGGWEFAMRSVVDANNYIEWNMSAVAGLPPTLSAWYRTGGGARTQVGANIIAYWPHYWLTLSNNVASDFLTWELASPWGASIAAMPAVTIVAGQRAANVAYLQLLFNQGNAATSFNVYLLDYVRFNT